MCLRRTILTCGRFTPAARNAALDRQMQAVMSVSGHAPGASGALVRVSAPPQQAATLAQQVCIDQMTLADVDVRPTPLPPSRPSAPARFVLRLPCRPL